MGSAIRKIIFDTIHKPYFEKILEERLNKAFNKWFKVYDVKADEDYFSFKINAKDETNCDVMKKLHSFFEGVDPIRTPILGEYVIYKVYWEDLLLNTQNVNSKCRKHMKIIEQHTQRMMSDCKYIIDLTKNW